MRCHFNSKRHFVLSLRLLVLAITVFAVLAQTESKIVEFGTNVRNDSSCGSSGVSCARFVQPSWEITRFVFSVPSDSDNNMTLSERAALAQRIELGFVVCADSDAEQWESSWREQDWIVSPFLLPWTGRESDWWLPWRASEWLPRRSVCGHQEALHRCALFHRIPAKHQQQGVGDEDEGQGSFLFEMTELKAVVTQSASLRFLLLNCYAATIPDTVHIELSHVRGVLLNQDGSPLSSGQAGLILFWPIATGVMALLWLGIVVFLVSQYWSCCSKKRRRAMPRLGWSLALSVSLKLVESAIHTAQSHVSNAVPLLALWQALLGRVTLCSYLTLWRSALGQPSPAILTATAALTGTAQLVALLLPILLLPETENGLWTVLAVLPLLKEATALQARQREALQGQLQLWTLLTDRPAPPHLPAALQGTQRHQSLLRVQGALLLLGPLLLWVFPPAQQALLTALPLHLLAPLLSYLAALLTLLREAPSSSSTPPSPSEEALPLLRSSSPHNNNNNSSSTSCAPPQQLVVVFPPRGYPPHQHGVQPPSLPLSVPLALADQL